MNSTKYQYEKRVFFLNEWITSKEKNEFVFSGIDKDDTSNKSVINVGQLVYDTDTVETLRYKIAKFCLKNENVKDIYMWVKCSLTNDEIIIFTQNLFKTDIKLSKEYINRITSVYFGKKFYKDDLHLKVIYEEFVQIFDAEFIYKSLDFRYNNVNDYTVFFSPRPFDKLNEIDDKSLKTNFLKSLLYKFNILDNEIHFVSKRSSNVPSFYFDNTYIFEPNFYNLMMNKMEIQDKFGKPEDILDSITNRLELLYFRVLPYSHDIQINMKTLFSISDTSYNIPFIVYKSKFTNEYKVNKIALSDMDTKQINNFQDQEFKQKDSVINRANDTIIYYIKLVDNVFFYFLLSDNGSYRLKYKFNKSNDIKIEDIMESFKKLDEIYEKLDDLMIYKLNKETELFHSNMIDIIEFNTQNTLTFKKPISTESFLKNVKTNNPFFQLIKSNSKSIFQIQFMDTNNFYNTDSVTAFIYNHMELRKTELIEKLKFYFKISEEEAISLYDEKKNKMNLKISKKGKNIFAVRTFHTAVNVKINILSDYSVKVNTVNTQDGMYQSLIMYYLMNYLTDKVVKDKLKKDGVKNKLKKSEQDEEQDETNEVNFNDLVDMDDDFDFDIDVIDELNLDVESPKPNIETDMSDYEDEINEENDDFIGESGKKTDYTTFVLDRLYKADRKLFLWKDVSTKLNNYSSMCGAVNYRQPVVINKKEKDNIDKNHPGSYTGFVQTGSTPELKAQNYYICPKIWCRVSKVSITMEEYKKHGNKCPQPNGEEAMFFPKEGSKDNYFITKHGTESRWPALLNKNKHPKNFELPCCGKKPLKTDVKLNNSNYVSNISTELLLNYKQYGNLPNLLNVLLNKKTACVGILNSKKQCYVRTGSDSTDNPLIRIIEYILDIDSFGEYVNKNMLLEHYVLLNGGNTLKLFMNNADQFKLMEKNEYQTFKTYFMENIGYVEKFHLDEEYEFIKSHDKMELNDDSVTKSIIREYLILNSFINFKNYMMEESVPKQLDDIYHMLTYEWLNTQNINFLFLNINKNNVFFINPKYYNYKMKYNKYKLNVIILKLAGGYEYVSYISQKPQNKQSEIYFQYETVQPIINSIDLQITDDDTDKLLNHQDVTSYILSTNLKCSGVIMNNKDVVILGKAKMLHYDDLKRVSFLYLDKMNKYNFSKEIMESYGKSYNKETIKFLKDNKTGATNLSLFVQDGNESNEDEKEKLYNDTLYKVVKKISIKPKLSNSIRVMNHSISNFTMNEKIYLLTKILKQNKVVEDDKDVDVNVERLMSDIIRIPINHILNEHKLKTHRKNKYELYLTNNDLMNNKLMEYFNKYKRNQFTVFDSSIEDFVDEINYIKLDNKNNVKVDGIMWSNLRKPILPMRIQKMFPAFMVIDEEISYTKLINFANSLDSSVTMESFQKNLTDRIMELFLSDSKHLYEMYSRNLNFEKHNIKKNKASVDDYVKLINNIDYHYSIFELEILSDILNYNIIILGRTTKLIKDGIYLIKSKKPSQQYLMFLYNIHEDRHGFNSITNSNEINQVFTANNFSTDTNKLLKLM
jgi:hypothetical protein